GASARMTRHERILGGERLSDLSLMLGLFGVVILVSALLSGFGFDARELAQSVTAAEVMTLIHTVAGVLAVDLEELLSYTDEPPPLDPVAAAVPAFGARPGAPAGSVLPAELLLINPAGVVLEEMAP
ncbi:MAG: hypothetical protein ACLGHY_09865, partial [Gammaproteobacteria bacterium]